MVYMEQIKDIFMKTEEQQTLIRMILASPRRKSLPYQKVIIRPLQLKGVPGYQVEYHYPQKVIHENISREDFTDTAIRFILLDFKQINLYTKEEDIQILAAKPTDPRILRNPATKKSTDISHNKRKKYILPEGEPRDFLIRLGVSDDKGKVYPKHYRKFRQINRYLEIVEDSLPHLQTGKPLRIIDFGCGKSYLTFALYYYLRIEKGLEVEMIGLDLKEDVIDFCNQIAHDLNYQGLTFLLGDIAQYKNDKADMVISLHACDTATDYALINAVAWGAKVILSVPCCQHELFGQLQDTLHQPLFRHGILKDRFTEILTDGIRGLKLEAAGYEVSMIEFTSLEHTSKNIMIKAVKGKPQLKKSRESLAAYDALVKYWAIRPAIDSLEVLPAASASASEASASEASAT